MKHIYVMLLFSILGFSCNPKEKVDSRNLAETDVKNLALDLIQLWETGDTLRTEKIFSKEGTYTDIANNQVFSGIHEINNYISHIHGWASEIKMTTKNIRITDKFGFIEWQLMAKQTKPIKGRIPVATNNNISLNGVSLIEVKNGKIEKASDYMDVLGFVIQLGSRVELPGGMVIGEQKRKQ